MSSETSEIGANQLCHALVAALAPIAQGGRPAGGRRAARLPPRLAHAPRRTRLVRGDHAGLGAGADARLQVRERVQQYVQANGRDRSEALSDRRPRRHESGVHGRRERDD